MGFNTRLPNRTYGDTVRPAVDRILMPLEKTSSYTLTKHDSGKLITNNGAEGAVTLTLPAPKAGLFFAFGKRTIAQDLVVQTNDESVKILDGADQAVSLTQSETQTYGYLELQCDGDHWFPTIKVGAWIAAT